LCIIETTEIVVKPFNEVDAGFAWDEGVRRSLTSLTGGEFIGRSSPRTVPIWDGTDETMLVVCERFRKLYPPTTPPARG
jgi:hypothetical protein